MQSDANNFKEKAIAYLNKFITQITVPTKNQFNLNYVLYLLFSIWVSKDINRTELLRAILIVPDFMDQNTYKPVRDTVRLTKSLFSLFNEREFELINSGENIDDCVLRFEKLYCLFYRNKVINKFIESTNKVLWDEVDLFADGWFIRYYNDEDQNALNIIGEDINAVLDLYVKSNKYLNLNIIQKWLDNTVEEDVLVEYYAKILEEFEVENLKSDGKVKLLDWLLSERIESVPKVKEKFAIVCKKFTGLDKMINTYVDKNSSATQKYSTLIEKYSGLIEKLKLPESV